MIAVGLTGGIGSGKSTVAGMLARRGAAVVDADQLAREVVEPGGPAHGPVLARFGADLAGPGGRIDRRRLAGIVFADPAARRDLDAIVHPAVATAMAERAGEHRGTDHVVVLEIPLLVEADIPRPAMAGVIVVDCPLEVAVARLAEQRGMSEEEVRARAAAQAGREERLAQADFVVDNSGSIEDLAAQVDRCWEWIGGLPAEA